MKINIQKFLVGPLFFGSSIFAQQRFTLNDVSEKYNTEITVEDCAENQCRSKGKVILFNKNGEKIQTLISPNLVMYFKENFKSSTVNVVPLKEDMLSDSPVFFGDFNFDGTEDVAIRNGNLGNYGSASYDVYVFNSTRNGFVPSKELTDLASNYNGMFDVDPERKLLTTYARSGGSLYYTFKYQVIPNKGLDLVYEKIQDTSVNPAKVTVREKIKNKWVVKKSFE